MIRRQNPAEHVRTRRNITHPFTFHPYRFTTIRAHDRNTPSCALFQNRAAFREASKRVLDRLFRALSRSDLLTMPAPAAFAAFSMAPRLLLRFISIAFGPATLSITPTIPRLHNCPTELFRLP